MKCPYCGKSLEFEDCFDTEELDEQYLRKEIFNCPKCHRVFQRNAYYKMEYSYDEWKEV